MPDTPTYDIETDPLFDGDPDNDILTPQELRDIREELSTGAADPWEDGLLLLAHIDALTAAPLDPQRLGRAIDRVEELDAVHGVVGRGSKAERVAAEYASAREPHDA